MFLVMIGFTAVYIAGCNIATIVLSEYHTHTVLYNPKLPSCRKGVWPSRGCCEKRCEIQQEMAMTVDKWQNF